jgi:acyl-CoA reductase-like NAD-dependent aldehyde dehydrogenase
MAQRGAGAYACCVTGNPAGLKRYRMLVGGEWVEGERTFQSSSPTTGAAWAEIPEAGADGVERAVAAARAAFEGDAWSSLTATARGTLLLRLADIIDLHAERLAEVESLDNGKLLRETTGQAKALSRWYRFYGGLADKLEGTLPAMDMPTVLSYISREPVGVVAAIAAWNSPLMLASWKIAPALAAGNTVVAKPSEFTSASLLELAELFEQAGFPAGVLNVVTGAAETGAALTSHPGVDHISFTGGADTGRAIARSAAENLVPLTLELGGKSPNIVFDDADLDAAVVGVLAGIFGATGQTCIAGSRLLVQSSIAQELTTRLIERAEQIVLGDPAAPDTQMGPIATPGQLERIQAHVDGAVRDGATVLTGGGRSEDPALAAGLFFRPTILGDVSPDAAIAREEVFGPVLVVIPFEDEDDAVRIANSTPYQLAAGVWSRDIKRAHRVTKRLTSGTVWVNMYRGASPLMPNGGSGESGYGRENGLQAIYEFTRSKSVWIELSDDVHDPFQVRL